MTTSEPHPYEKSSNSERVSEVTNDNTANSELATHSEAYEPLRITSLEMEMDNVYENPDDALGKAKGRNPGPFSANY